MHVQHCTCSGFHICMYNTVHAQVFIFAILLIGTSSWWCKTLGTEVVVLVVMFYGHEQSLNHISLKSRPRVCPESSTMQDTNSS